LVQDVVAAE
jgi:hypothetical protein